MEIDKFKLAFRIKLFLFSFYIFYLIFYNTELNIYLPINKKNTDAIFKKIIFNDSCLLIIGGSNVRQGLSAQIISENICPALNLGVFQEMGSFDSYGEWLKYNLVDRKYNYILYSPIFFWNQNKVISKNLNNFEIPKIPIFSQFKYLINNNKYIFNSKGDMINFECNSKLKTFDIDEENFSSFDIITSQELIRRVSELKDIMKTNNIYLRVPPIYAENEKQAERYLRLMNKRIEILKGFGIKIVDSTLVSTNSTLFCDSLHPNVKGRELFSNEIRLP